MRNNLPKLKDGPYLIYLDKDQSIESYWVALYVNSDIFWYIFIEFSIDRVQKKIKKFIGNKNITTNIFRIQAYASIMCGYICIGFVDFFFKKVKVS